MRERERERDERERERERERNFWLFWHLITGRILTYWMHVRKRVTQQMLCL